MNTATLAPAPRVLYTGLRFQHHQPGSGYDLVAPRGAAHVSADRVPLIGGRRDGSTPRKLSLAVADVVTLLRGLRHRVIHYYYPEDTAFLSAPVLRLLGRRIVFTLHLVDAVWLEGRGMGWTFRFKQSSLRHAHVIVTLSSAQQRRFAACFPDKQVVFVPHGFEPLAQPVAVAQFMRRHAGRQLLVVGENYRDFDQLARIVAGRGERDVTFHLVGVGAAARRRFESSPGVVVHDRLSDAAYALRMDSSFALLLPLSFATANNALLEAHKWALPVFCSDVEGARDYATAQTQCFADDADFWRRHDQLAALSATDYIAHSRASAADAQARFRWDAVRLALRAVYAGAAPHGGRPW